MNLRNKVVVVTGGAGLLGSSICKKVSEFDGVAVVADIDIEKANDLSKILKNSYSCQLDINSKDSILALVNHLHEKFGRIDALINNAYPRNKNYGNHFFDVEYQDFCENININLGGYFLTSQCFSKYFLDQGIGNIISIASIYGVVAPKFEIYEGTNMTTPVEYSVIKSGLIHFTKYLANYFKGKNINVNSVSPGGINDGQADEFINNYKSNCLNKGMLDSDDLSGVISFLLSDEARFINGQNIIVDDGFSI